MKRYEKLGKLDELAEILYRTDYEDENVCMGSPLRVNGGIDCPVEEDGINEESCKRCIKAWLMEEVEDEDH